MGRGDGVFRRALALGRSCRGATHNLGYAFHVKGVLEDATACYRRALALQPQICPAVSKPWCGAGKRWDDSMKRSKSIARG